MTKPLPLGVSMAFEILHVALVFLSCFATIESAEIASLLCLRIDLARVESVLAGF